MFDRFIRFIGPTLIKFIALFHLPVLETTDEEFLELKSLIRDGDSLVSRTDWEFSNLFEAGEWKHAAVYFDGYVYEAVTTGVRKSLLEDFFFRKDHVGLCRCEEFKKDLSDKGLDFLKAQIGLPYDWSFSLASKNAYYCAELVFGFLQVTAQVNVSMTDYFGQEVVSPTDIWNSLTQIKRWG